VSKSTLVKSQNILNLLNVGLECPAWSSLENDAQGYSEILVTIYGTTRTRRH